jgi:hypothetical protein
MPRKAPGLPAGVVAFQLGTTGHGGWGTGGSTFTVVSDRFFLGWPEAQEISAALARAANGL